MSPNDADGMANSEDSDQTAPIWVCTVCPGLAVRKLRIITVHEYVWHVQRKRTTHENCEETGSNSEMKFSLCIYRQSYL